MMNTVELNKKIDKIMDRANTHYVLQERAKGNIILEKMVEDMKCAGKTYFAIEIAQIGVIDMNDELIVRKLNSLKQLLYLIDMDVVADTIIL